MKIEKISENQIKCTLEREELTSRGMDLTGLAYGSESAKLLFHEIMKQAYYEFGFETEDTPVMVEAIPLPAGNLTLLVTKVDEPDELDTRFSKFSPENKEKGIVYGSGLEEDGKEFSESKEVHEFIPLPEIIKEKSEEIKKEDTTSSHPIHNPVKIYGFGSIEDITEPAKKITELFTGSSSVYKDSDHGKYYLVLERSASDKERFGRVCNILSEYATPVRSNYATLSYIKEHYDVLIKSDAIPILTVI